MNARVEAAVVQPGQPVGAREAAFLMLIVFDRDVPIRVAQQEGVVHREDRRVRRQVVGPHQVTEPAAVGAVLAAALGRRLEGLSHAIGHDDDKPPGPAVAGRRAQRRADRCRAGGVHDGVVNQHAVEQFAEKSGEVMSPITCSHSGLTAATDGKHARRPVGQRQVEVVLEMPRQAAAAGAKLQERPPRAVVAIEQQRQQVRGFLDVVGWWRHQRPPDRQIAVEPQRLVGHVGRCRRRAGRASGIVRGQGIRDPRSPGRVWSHGH